MRDRSSSCCSWEYLFLGSRRFGKYANDITRFNHQDHLGSSRAITDSTGHLRYDTDFYPFGGERVVTNTCAQNYKFTGMERDSETAQDHTWFRQYASNLGRWLSPDLRGRKIFNLQTLNRDAYLINNDVSFIGRVGQ